MLLLTRYGYLEETYYSHRFVPVIGDDGYVVGHYANPLDATKEVLSRRRALSAQHIGIQIAASRKTSELWPRFLSSFGPIKEDFPLVALYATSQHASDPTSLQSARVTCLLEGTIGVPESHLPSRLVLPRDRSTVKFRTSNVEKLLACLFQSSLDSTDSLLLTRDKLPDTFLKGVSWRGFGSPSQEFLITPLRTNKGVVLGFMFAGLNPFKRFRQDNDYLDYVNTITQQVVIPKATSILQTEEITSGEERLILRSNELQRSEARYRNFAEHAPIGVALVTPDRCMEFANEAW